MISKAAQQTSNTLTQLLAAAIGHVLLCGALVASMSLALTADDRLLGRPANKRESVSVGQGDQLVLQFKLSPIVDSQVVRLGDLVEVVSWGARAHEDLLAFPLGPAPQVGQYQDWTSNDLVRNLELRGINKSKVAWHGPTAVRLMRRRQSEATSQPQTPETKKVMPAFLNDRLLDQASANLIQATREYLWQQTDERTQWRIALKVPNELASSLAQKRNILSIGGGQEPWTGKQRLVYVVKHQNEELELTMTVDVELPSVVVVANRAIRRDEVIDESCLAYAALPERLEGQVGEYYDDMADLVGKQMRKAMSTGVPIPRASIGEPNVISGGEIIEIESVSGGIVVKAAAKALQGGAVGELINVELIPGRKRISATVVGPMLVRISGKTEIRNSPADPEAQEAPRAPIKTVRNVPARGVIR